MAATKKHTRGKLESKLETLACALETEAAQADHYESGLGIDHAEAAKAVREAMRLIKGSN